MILFHYYYLDEILAEVVTDLITAIVDDSILSESISECDEDSACTILLDVPEDIDDSICEYSEDSGLDVIDELDECSEELVEHNDS